MTAPLSALRTKVRNRDRGTAYSWCLESVFNKLIEVAGKKSKGTNPWRGWVLGEQKQQEQSSQALGERRVKAGLKGLGTTSSSGSLALGVVRAFVTVFALVLLPAAGLAFPRPRQGYSPAQPDIYSGPRPQGFYARPGFYAAPRQRVFFAGPPHSRPASPSGPRGQAYPGGGRQQPQQPQQPPHLGTWLQRHGNMSLPEQERALQNEPGFNRLAPQTQHQLVDRLRQIDSMPAEQRERTLGRIEALERLSPQMRQQVSASAEAIRTLPAERQRMVKKAFRDLRDDPPEQRQSLMASPQFQEQFTPQERGILSNLLSVEPYEPNAGFRPEYSPPGR
jgi:hypothetical protein